MTAKDSMLLVAGAGIVLALWWGMSRFGVRTTATAIGTGAVEAADGFLSGTTIALGDSIGIPHTDVDKCEAAIAAGDTWEASFACSAGRFLGYVWN